MGFSKCTQTWYYIVPYLVSICDLKNLDSFCGTWHKPLGWAPFLKKKFKLDVGCSKCTYTWYCIVPHLASFCDLKNVDSVCGT